MTYLVHLVVLLEISLIIAASLNLLVGYAGLLLLAQAGFYGVGAYVSARLLQETGIGFIPSAAIAYAAAGVASHLVSLPSWRLRGEAFVLLSLAAQGLFYAVFHNSVSATGGPFGLSGVPRPDIFGVKIATAGGVATLFGLIAACCLGYLAVLKRSPFGRRLQAVRDDELAARSLGIQTRWIKVQACAVSSGLAGLAGAMYASYASYIDPTSFSLDESILMMSMVIVGGTGNLRGPLVGAAVLLAIPEALRFVAVPDSIAGTIRLLVYGLLLVVLMLVRPQGLAGRYRFE